MSPAQNAPWWPLARILRWWATWKGPTIPNGYTEIIEPGNRAEPGKYITSFTDTQTLWVELIKTGPIKQGKLSIASNVEVVYYCPYSNQWAVSVAGVSSVAAAPKCSLSNPVPQIELGKISTTAFNEVGARSAPVLFSISLLSMTTWHAYKPAMATSTRPTNTSTSSWVRANPFRATNASNSRHTRISVLALPTANAPRIRCNNWTA